MSRTFFAYHLSHFFGPFGLESYHTNSDKPAEGDLVYVISGSKEETDGGVDYWLEGVFRIHRKNPGTYVLRSLKGAQKVFSYRLSMEPVRVPDAPIPLSKASWYSRKEIHDYFSSGQNFNPLPTQPDYKERFDELLAEYGLSREIEIDEDLAEIKKATSDATERDALTKARIGQGRFRCDVSKVWGIGEVCALTGLAIPELLTASHVRPWRDSSNEQRLDPCNGLLLVAHADRLFDRNLLSFREERDELRSVIHPRLRAGLKAFGLNEGMALRASRLGVGQFRRFSYYMREHFDRFTAQVKADTPTERR